jgi:hypothetical protein
MTRAAAVPPGDLPRIRLADPGSHKSALNVWV